LATQNRFNAAVHFHLWASVTRISSLTKQSNAYLMGANFVLMRLLQRRRAARTFNVHLYHTGAIIEHNVSSRVVVLVVPHRYNTAIERVPAILASGSRRKRRPS